MSNKLAKNSREDIVNYYLLSLTMLLKEDYLDCDNGIRLIKYSNTASKARLSRFTEIYALLIEEFKKVDNTLLFKNTKEINFLKCSLEQFKYFSYSSICSESIKISYFASQYIYFENLFEKIIDLYKIESNDIIQFDATRILLIVSRSFSKKKLEEIENEIIKLNLYKAQKIKSVNL
jgi:hypothetical protein